MISSLRRVLPTLLMMVLFASLLSFGFQEEAQAADSPETVLDKEADILRGVILKDRAFVERLERYRIYGGLLVKVPAMLDDWRPIFEGAAQIQDMGNQGLFMILSLVDSRFDLLPKVLQTFSKTQQISERIGTIGQQMMLLTGHIDHLMASQRLTPDELRSLRVIGIPEGQAAMKGFATSYREIRPVVVELDVQIAQVEKLLMEFIRDQGGQLGGTLGALLGSGAINLNLSGVGLPQVKAFFQEIRSIRADLDALSESTEADIESLNKLQAALLNAEAHHVYAQANAMVTEGHREQAKETLKMIGEVYPSTQWAKQSLQRLRSLEKVASSQVASASAPQSAESGGDSEPAGQGVPLWGVILVVLGGVGVGGVGVHFWSQRSAQKEV